MPYYRFLVAWYSRQHTKIGLRTISDVSGAAQIGTAFF